MSDDAVETAASIVTQKIDKEHKRHSLKKTSQQTRSGSTKRHGSTKLQQQLSEQCDCSHLKIELEEGMKSPMIEKRTSGTINDRRQAIAEKNETERILTKETVKVMAKNSGFQTFNLCSNKPNGCL